MKRKTPIYTLGDIHGNYHVILAWIINFDIRDCFIIQVGDFGIGFSTGISHECGDTDQKNYEKEILEKVNLELIERNIILYVVRGNHDNPNRFDGTYKIGNIHFLKDYTILELEGIRILCVGGAISIDKKIRTVGQDWWPDEKFILDEEKLKDIENIDVVITHTAPSFCHPQKWNTLVYDYADKDPGLYQELPHERLMLESMWNILKEKNKIKKWFYGHFHFSHKAKHSGTEFILLTINEFQEITIADIEEDNIKI